jgi:hypothetical protein
MNTYRSIEEYIFFGYPSYMKGTAPANDNSLSSN